MATTLRTKVPTGDIAPANEPEEGEPNERRAAASDALPQRPRGASVPRRWRIIVGLVSAAFAIYFLLPVYWLVIAATKSTPDLFGSFGLWFSNPQLIANLTTVLTYDGGIFPRWALNSVVYSLLGTILSTILAAGAGYVLAKFRFRGREAIFTAVIGGVLIPTTALALPLFLLFSKVGLTNTYWSVLLPTIVSPFGVYVCRIYAESAIPDSIMEAARIDGAGEFRVFAQFGLPMMVPSLVTVFLFHFVSVWNNFFLPLVMLSSTELYPLTLGLKSWLSVADRQPILYQATVGGALLSVIPLIVLILSLQKYWRSGIAQGSVKG